MNTLTVKLINNELVVFAPKHLRDNHWADGIGNIQTTIDLYAKESSHTPIVFDFTECRWIDPLPLLSLMIEIINAKKSGLTITVNFPMWDSGPLKSDFQQPYQNSPNRLLLFLATENFFCQLLTNRVRVTIGGRSVTRKLIDECSKLKAKASYADARLIPIKLLNVSLLNEDKSNNYAAKQIVGLLNEAEVILRSRFSVQENRHLLYNLKVVLEELILNAQQHAYMHEIDFCPVAIYVRYRQGGMAFVDVDWQKFYKACVELEKKNCERLDDSWLNSKRGCLEVFVVDRGIGITNKYNETRGKKVDFATVMKETFLDGKSTKVPHDTEHGGLHLLHNRLKINNDYLRAINGSSWFGAQVPFVRPAQSVAKLSKAKYPFKGLAYHLRLSWKAKTDIDENWLKFSADEIKVVWKDLSITPEKYSRSFNFLEKCKVVDDRFGVSNDFIPDKENLENHLLWLPHRGLMKGDILAKLETISKTLKEGIHIVIGDICSTEAAMYSAAISNTKFIQNNHWPEKLRTITLVTNRLTFASTYHEKFENGYHGFSKLDIKNVPEKAKHGLKTKIDENLSFRRLVVHWLKWHDSKLFWQRAESLPKHYLHERVDWRENAQHVVTKTIDGYLNFPSTTHDYLFAKLYRNALGRVVGLLQENYAFEAIDNLAESVVNDAYVNEFYDAKFSEQSDENHIVDKVFVGSVYVSGLTLKAIGADQSKTVHFFIHRDSEGELQPSGLFHWLVQKANIEATSKATQKRIGKTSEIAPKGWLSIDIPRLNASGTVAGFRHPDQSYQDWQSSGPVIAKFGHWHYEGHHDLITLNIPDAAEDAFLKRAKLAEFLIQNISVPLGVTTKDFLSPLKFELLQDPVPSILVYRSHASSERIIKLILDELKPDARTKALKLIFPILPLRKRSGGSTLLVPPRMTADIQIALKNCPKALIFDDASISGRTIQDLRASLKNLGANEIQIVTIANRLRLPSETGAIKYYWRFDVPTMGRESNCPLCQALESIKSFKNHLVKYNEADNTITDWLKMWSPMSTINSWHAGLDPLPLDKTLHKNFCYQESDTPLFQIPISRSTGVVIHAAEVHAMTASDDYGLKKIKEHDKAELKIELASSQLFLFGNELDQDLILDFAIYGLLEPFVSLDSKSPYCALAFVAMVRTLTILKNTVQDKFVKETEDKISKLKASLHGMILMAYLSQKYSLQKDDTWFAGLRLLSTRHDDVASKLRTLFRETVSYYGDRHSEPIPRLIQSFSNYSSPPSDAQIMKAIGSLDKLIDIIDELGTDLAAASVNQQSDITVVVYTEVRDELKQKIFDAKNACNAVITSGTRVENQLSSIKICLENVIEKLNQFADYYFYRVNNSDAANRQNFPHTVTSILSAIKDENQRDETTQKIKTSQKSEQINYSNGCTWVLWHKHTQAIVYDLLINVVHVAGVIKDPFSTDVTTAHMWLNITFNRETVDLFFANDCAERSPEDIFMELKKGSENKTSWSQLTRLGGEIERLTNDSDSKLLMVKVSLPYAQYLGQSK